MYIRTEDGTILNWNNICAIKVNKSLQESEGALNDLVQGLPPAPIRWQLVACVSQVNVNGAAEFPIITCHEQEAKEILDDILDTLCKEGHSFPKKLTQLIAKRELAARQK